MLRILLLLLVSASSYADDGFVDLFDGESIDGWVQRGGEAVYTVVADAEGGPQIVGASVADTPNSFLCTPRDYTDFVLEFEVKVDRSLNSGVQFRSLCFDEPRTVELPDGSSKRVPAGRVHGYQVEIDPSDRAYSGGVYDEARRGWLYDLAGDKHAEARAAFDRDGWNAYRVEARGDHIETSINGVPCAHLHDGMTPSGFIALQVHSIRNPNQEGKQVRWRNIRIKEL